MIGEQVKLCNKLCVYTDTAQMLITWVAFTTKLMLAITATGPTTMYTENYFLIRRHGSNTLYTCRHHVYSMTFSLGDIALHM